MVANEYAVVSLLPLCLCCELVLKSALGHTTRLFPLTIVAIASAITILFPNQYPLGMLCLSINPDDLLH